MKALPAPPQQLDEKLLVDYPDIVEVFFVSLSLRNPAGRLNKTFWKVYSDLEESAKNKFY